MSLEIDKLRWEIHLLKKNNPQITLPTNEDVERYGKTVPFGGSSSSPSVLLYLAEIAALVMLSVAIAALQFRH